MPKNLEFAVAEEFRFSPDYDRDDETEDQILIIPSDTDRKDHEFKSTMNGPLVDNLTAQAMILSIYSSA